MSEDGVQDGVQDAPQGQKGSGDEIKTKAIKGTGIAVGRNAKAISDNRTFNLFFNSPVVPQGPREGDSRTDLLLKKATLLQAEAGQAVQENLERVGPQLMEKAKAMGASGALEKAQITDGSMAPFFSAMGSLFKEAVDQATISKLEKALDLVNQVLDLEPDNIEALLLKWRVLLLLDLGDIRTWRSPLRLIDGLITTPKNDVESLQLAQAKLFLAMSSDPFDVVGLKQARDLFNATGRKEYVDQIDSVLASQAASSGAWPPSPYGQAPPNAAFQPLGRWQIQNNSGQVTIVDLYPNFTLQGIIVIMGWNHPIGGQWNFNPNNQLLQMQGYIDGYNPFLWNLMIQVPQGNGYAGVDGAGIPFFINRA